MHNQHTLHLTDQQYQLAVSLLTFTEMDVTDAALIEAMTDEGIRQYPAEKLVEQRARFYNKFPTNDPLFDRLSDLTLNPAFINTDASIKSLFGDFMTDTLAKDVLNGLSFKLNEQINVSPEKHFTVVDVSLSVNPVSGDVNVNLTVNYVFGDKSGTDVINSRQLKEFLK